MTIADYIPLGVALAAIGLRVSLLWRDLPGQQQQAAQPTQF